MMDRRGLRHWFLALGFGLAGAIGPVHAQELCGGIDYPFPYTDVSAVGSAFCAGIMEAYVTGISKGTTPTTFSPNNTVIRSEMTTFLQRTFDQALARTSRRAALRRWWTPRNRDAMQATGVGGTPQFCEADNENIWTTTFGTVAQVQASTGKVVGTWTGAASSSALLVAAGRVFVTGGTTPGSLYVIDPTQSPGTVTVAASNLGNSPYGIAFDGTYLWTANSGPPGSVSVIVPHSSYFSVTLTTGFNSPVGILYDGVDIWVTDDGAGTLLRLDTTTLTILQTVDVGVAPVFPVFDGSNIWVPNFGSNSITVVQASTGDVVATIMADATNLLNGPNGISFDGERILVTNNMGNSVSVFKAADLSFIANVPTGASTGPIGACSDGVNFWVPLLGTGQLLRF